MSTPVPAWHTSSPMAAPRPTRQAVRTERSTSTGRRRAIVRVVSGDPARIRDASR
ncbi:hypothetical protein ACFFUA_15210 [Streptomyces heliomycini]|uniref:Uncharacterized protein n=1 Tax=Streptomyces heliomycini TaxID=284032 RepID=A0ABV5LB94_9ACTN